MIKIPRGMRLRGCSRGDARLVFQVGRPTQGIVKERGAYGRDQDRNAAVDRISDVATGAI
jgi:hypothetical protein